MTKTCKTLLAIAVLVLLLAKTNTIQAQLTIPTKILSFFDEKYPDATEVVWQKSIFKYVASFKNAQNEVCFISFNSNGNWKYTKSDLAYNSLPTEVINTYENSLYDKSHGWSISGVDKFSSPEISFAYRLHIYKGVINKKAIYITETGKMLKIENDL